MLSVFWGSQGILFWELLEKNERVNANVCMKQLQKLADAVRKKRPKRLEVALMHDKRDTSYDDIDVVISGELRLDDCTSPSL